MGALERDANVIANPAGAIDATQMRTTRPSTGRGANAPSKITLTKLPILRGTPHSARRPVWRNIDERRLGAVRREREPADRWNGGRRLPWRAAMIPLDSRHRRRRISRQRCFRRRPWFLRLRRRAPHHLSRRFQALAPSSRRNARTLSTTSTHPPRRLVRRVGGHSHVFGSAGGALPADGLSTGRIAAPEMPRAAHRPAASRFQLWGRPQTSTGSTRTSPVHRHVRRTS